MAHTTFTAEELRQQVAYNPETGVFTRLVKNDFNPRSVVGRPLGWRYTNGYVGFRVNRQRYLAHRLAWLYVHGQWPQGDLDHVNGDRADNRIANLRQATRSQNMANTATLATNTSGHRGVTFDKATQKWMAHMQVAGRFVNLGRFAVLADAVTARQRAFASTFGEFAGRGASTCQ